MPKTVISGFTHNFLGNVLAWYKQTILLFLLINLLVVRLIGAVAAGWLLAVVALLSAFLDALTVTAVIITVAVGFYPVYHKVASRRGYHHSDHNAQSDEHVIELHREDLVQFRGFLVT